MPLPRKLEEQVRKRFEELIQEGKAIQETGMVNIEDVARFTKFRVSVSNLANRILVEPRRQGVLDELDRLRTNIYENETLAMVFGILDSLRTDYEAGILDDLSRMIEATVTYDFMEQAEQLLDGERPDYDHVPAAVLAGAVLENGLRRLCQRQSPPIEAVKATGQPKRLNSLIDELQGKAFTPAKADQLRSWAKIRNSVGHGDIDEFSRADVEDMIAGIKRFLAEYDL